MTKENIVCIHGLGRTPFSMWRIKLLAKQQHYVAYTWGYASREASSDNQADALEQFIEQTFTKEGETIHFITHSLGGYILSKYLKKADARKSGRVVMIAPPLGGSAVVDEGLKWPLFGDYFGPVITEMNTRPVAANHPELHPEIAVIAGSRPQWPLSPLFFDEPNDGKVSVRSTMNIHAKEHAVVAYNHTEIIYRTEVIEQALRFIKTGSLYIPPQ